MKFAFLIMGSFDSMTDRAAIAGGGARIIGVSDIDDACAAARALLDEGVGCIELCGAFGEKGAEKVIEATENKIPIGYVTHLPIQDDLYERAFS